MSRIDEPSPAPSAPWLDTLERRSLTLEGLCCPFLLCPAAAELATRLSSARAFLSRGGAAKCVTAVLLGPTGAGKSTLFNALIRRANASPVSDDIRCFTDRPYVAGDPRWKPLISIPEALNPCFIEADLGDLLLCDLPDVDGVLQQHWEVARRLIEQCDIVVVVTSPEKRADFRVHDEIRCWAARKRWLFVLNRADQIPEESREKAVQDWDRRLEEGGLHPDGTCRFLVSALQPHRFEFAEFRRTLLERDYRKDLEHLRWDGFCGHLQYATGDEILGPLRELAAALEEAENGLRQGLSETYRQALSRPRTVAAFRQAVIHQAWRWTAERTTGFAALAAWLRTRWFHVLATYRLVRLGFRRLSLWEVAAASFYALRAALTGVLPLKRIVDAMTPDLKRELSRTAQDVRRILEDHRLATPGVLPEEEARTTAPPPASTPATNSPPEGWIESTLHRLMGEPGDPGLLEDLQAAVEEQAEQIVAAATRPWVNGLANLLPFCVLADIAIRIGYAWVLTAWYAGAENAEYLPANFYGLALGLLGLSILPGHWLIASRIAGQLRRLNPSQDFRITAPTVLEPLAARRRELELLIANAESLRGQAGQVRKMLSADLPGAAAMIQANRNGQRTQQAMGAA